LSFGVCFGPIAEPLIFAFCLDFGFSHGAANVFQPEQFHVLSAAGQRMLGSASNVGLGFAVKTINLSYLSRLFPFQLPAREATVSVQFPGIGAIARIPKLHPSTAEGFIGSESLGRG